MQIEKPDFMYKACSDVLPSNLVGVDKILPILHISKERALQLTKDGYIPHYLIGESEPLYRLPEVKRWAAKNFVQQCNGRMVPTNFKVYSFNKKHKTEPPHTIKDIPYLTDVPYWDVSPGIYFLCLGDEVVYVGQTVALMSRIENHKKEKRNQFDRVYFIPCPTEKLNELEGAFINALEPKLNGRTSTGKFVAPISNIDIKSLGVKLAQGKVDA